VPRPRRILQRFEHEIRHSNVANVLRKGESSR